MMHLRGFVLFLLCLAGGARRSLRIRNSQQDAHEQNNTLANGLEVSAEAWQSLIPSVLRTGVYRRWHPKTDDLSKESKYRAAATRMALHDAIHNVGANVDAAPAAVYSGSMKFVLDQTDLEFDAWQVGTLTDYPWLAEQLGIEVNAADVALDINNEFCAANRDFCTRMTTSNRGGVPAMSAATDDFVPDMQRRTIMNLVLLGGAGVPVLWLAGGFVYFFVPPSGGGGGGGLTALDAQGDAVLADAWAKEHPFPTRSLVQGLKGDAHYLIVKEDGLLEDYAINAVCTHLGCVVPWNRAANKYMCPCHGSQYDPTGKVIRGPAPLSLALAHVENADGKVVLSPWTETDFRTNTAPWWKP